MIRNRSVHLSTWPGRVDTQFVSLCRHIRPRGQPRGNRGVGGLRLRMGRRTPLHVRWVPPDAVHCCRRDRQQDRDARSRDEYRRRAGPPPDHARRKGRFGPPPRRTRRRGLYGRSRTRLTGRRVRRLRSQAGGTRRQATGRRRGMPTSLVRRPTRRRGTSARYPRCPRNTETGLRAETRPGGQCRSGNRTGRRHR